MIIVYVNGEKMTMPKQVSLADLLAVYGHNQEHCAIALNQRVIHRAERATTILSTDDVIDIVMPMQGG